MNIEVKLFMKFKNYLPRDSKEDGAIICLKEGSTVDDLLRALGIPTNEPMVLVINGASQGIDNAQALKDGDGVFIFPPVGGG
jgi:molybdopterin converting factor small subunit